VILKRAKRRTLYLLKDMDRTEHQIRMKLKEGLYPEFIIEKAIEYAKGYHYIDDENYARRFVEYRSQTKSKLEIIAQLKNKGISKEAVDQFYCENEIDDTQAIIKLMNKKRYNPHEDNKEKQKKMYMYLCRKGFGYDDIESAIEQAKRDHFE
jgi:regulatory protein